MSKNELLDDLTFIEVFDPVYKYQIKNTVGDVSSTTTVSLSPEIGRASCRERVLRLV